MRTNFGGYSTRSFAYVSPEDDEAEVNITAGDGLVATPTVITNTGTIAMPNIGTAGTYAYPASVSTDTQGRVTSITAGVALSLTSANIPIVLTPTTINSVGTIGLQTGVVTAGDYAYPSEVLVDTYGRVTSITAGVGPTPLPTAGQFFASNATGADISDTVTVLPGWTNARLSACAGAAGGQCGDNSLNTGGAGGGAGAFVRDIPLLPGDIITYTLGKAGTGGTVPGAFGITPGATLVSITRGGIVGTTLILGAPVGSVGGVATVPAGTVATGVYSGANGGAGGTAGGNGFNSGMVWMTQFGQAIGGTGGSYSGGGGGASSLFGLGGNGRDTNGGSQTNGGISAGGGGGSGLITSAAIYGSDGFGGTIVIDYFM